MAFCFDTSSRIYATRNGFREPLQSPLYAPHRYALLVFSRLEALLEILWLWRVSQRETVVINRRLDEEKDVILDNKSHPLQDCHDHTASILLSQSKKIFGHSILLGASAKVRSEHLLFKQKPHTAYSSLSQAAGLCPGSRVGMPSVDFYSPSALSRNSTPFSYYLMHLRTRSFRNATS